MTDHDEAMIPLGRRLDGLARTRIAAMATLPAWTAPLAVALRHIEEVADVLGDRFERTDTPLTTEQPLEAHLPAAPLAAPGSVAGRGRPLPHDSSTVAREGETAPGKQRDAEAPDEDLREVPADVRSRLRREVGPAADLMRVHTGSRADAHARAADADAVTRGADVYLRQDRWAPRREEGVALLAHEATHVSGLVDPGKAWRRAVGGAAEEAVARAHERSLLGPGATRLPTAPGGGTGWPGTGNGLGTPFDSSSGHGDDPESATLALPGQAGRPGPAGAPAAPSGPHAGAALGAGMRAGVERDLSPAPATPDLDALRRGVVAEVMQRLRSEIERGA